MAYRISWEKSHKLWEKSHNTMSSLGKYEVWLTKRLDQATTCDVIVMNAHLRITLILFILFKIWSYFGVYDSPVCRIRSKITAELKSNIFFAPGATGPFFSRLIEEVRKLLKWPQMIFWPSKWSSMYRWVNLNKTLFPKIHCSCRFRAKKTNLTVILLRIRYTNRMIRLMWKMTKTAIWIKINPFQILRFPVV